VRETIAWAVQPEALAPVRVYVVFVAGDTLTVCVVAPDGIQV
jgi:hypothetical protein